jgi:SAM-dependent methyltransferase
MTTLLERCLCGSAATGPEEWVHGVPVLRCHACGVVRQDTRLTAAELARWYATQYHAGVYQHDYAHDRAVAEQRLSAYAISAGSKILDVGAGNGAFVHRARAAGLDAWGQDLATQSDGPHVYVGALEDVAFPTGEFDVVTVHDVLEHVPDPVAFLQEIRRVLKPRGRLIVDFPRFWHEAGAHHWKAIEHLWCLTEDELASLLGRAGFVAPVLGYPIPSKAVVSARARDVERVRILVPAGIGDAFWVMTKLQGFLRERGITDPPDILVQDAGGPKRTAPFIRTVPFVHAAGYEVLRTHHPIWQQAYMQDAATVYERPFPSIDWFLAYNGVMRHGRSLADVDPQWAPDWHPRLHVSKEAIAFHDACRAEGPYILAYFTDAGMYRKWLDAFPPEQIRDALRLLEARLGMRVLFMGAEWDRGMSGEALAQTEAGWVDLVGETTYDQMVGAILGASLVVGYPAGNTILASVFRVPSVLLWHRYFVPEFWTNACAPDAPYAALDTAGLTPEAILAAAQMVLPGDARVVADARMTAARALA